MNYNRGQIITFIVICALALILPLLACASDIEVTVSAKRGDLTREDSAAIWIVAWHNNGKASMGQGVVVAPKKVLTCAHVVKDAYQIVVFAFDPRTKPDSWMRGDGWSKMKLVKKDEASDLALLTDDTAVRWTGKINALADMAYDEGYLCRAGDAPVPGRANMYYWDFGGTDHGDSGAPILNHYGELIGIVSQSSTWAGTTTSVSWQAIRSFLASVHL